MKDGECYSGETCARFYFVEVSLIGRHNLKNALSVYAMGRTIGFEREQLLDGFRTFRGVKRRQEIRLLVLSYSWLVANGIQDKRQDI